MAPWGSCSCQSSAVLELLQPTSVWGMLDPLCALIGCMGQKVIGKGAVSLLRINYKDRSHTASTINFFPQRILNFILCEKCISVKCPGLVQKDCKSLQMFRWVIEVLSTFLVPFWTVRFCTCLPSVIDFFLPLTFWDTLSPTINMISSLFTRYDDSC